MFVHKQEHYDYTNTNGYEINEKLSIQAYWYSQDISWNVSKDLMGCRGRDRIVVGLTTTNATSAYHHWCCEFESQSGI